VKDARRGIIPRSGPALLAGVLSLLAIVMPAEAVETVVRVEGPADLARGDLDGVAVTTTGRLFLAPRFSPLSGDESTVMAAQVWSVAADRLGNVYLGTGPEGRIVRIEPGGRATLLYRVAEPMVTALAVLPSGDLLAGTAPEGLIYRVPPDGRGKLWVETGERYVWDLAVTPDGGIYAATGERGILLEIDDRGEFEVLFDSSEAHLVALHVLPEGGILAGGGSHGLVFQIDSQGHALVLHDDELPEVSGLALGSDGTVVAAMLASPPSAPRKPAVRIRLPEAVAVGTASDQVEELDEPAGPTLEGVIEGLPVADAEGPERLRGRLVRIHPDGPVEEIWKSATEAPYAVALDDAGRVLFGTGEPARLYRADAVGDVALLATLREAQITGLLTAGGNVVAATSNPGTSYRLGWDSEEPGIFLSRPFDAGGTARWGRIRWRPRGPLGSIELYTRTGNSEKPDATWSAWSPALTIPDGSRIVNPDGRYLQWRVRMSGRREQDVWISGIDVTYLPYNRPPAIREFVLSGGKMPFARGEASFAWSEMDPDGDPVESRLLVREPGTDAWTEAESWTVGAPNDESATRTDFWRRREARWSLGQVPEGPYEVRLELSDEARNHPGEGARVTDDAGLVVTVDRTPPQVETRADGSGAVEVRVDDALSWVLRLEVLVGGRADHIAAAEDGVCDSRSETFRVGVPRDSPAGSVVIRAVDAAGNVTEQAL
jgi:hypothetical protein